MPDRICRLSLLACLCLVLVLTVSACGSDDDAGDGASSGGDQLEVGTTVAPITSIVANIGGDRVKITGIVPEGTNSHTFEPKPSVAELLSTHRRAVRQRPEARGADEGARRGEPQGRRGDRRAGHEVDPRERVRLRLLVPEVRWQAQPAPVDRSEVRAEVRRDRPRRPLPSATPTTPTYFKSNYDKFKTKVDEFDKAMRASFATLPRDEAQAADLPRRVRVLRQGLRLGRRRRDPGLGFRGSDAQGGRVADRPGARGEGDRDLRFGGLPESGAPADRQGDRREVRRRAARRRPARASPARPSTPGWG